MVIDKLMMSSATHLASLATVEGTSASSDGL